MQSKVKSGDLILSLAGRDKGNCFLVISVEDDFADIVDGKIHKIQKPKRKNVKHIKTILTAKYKNFADKIKIGLAVGNKTLYQLIKAEKEKLQED